jgi:hypothetical protein
MYTSDDFAQPGTSKGILEIPALVFRGGSLLLLGPLDEGLQPLRRLLGLGLMLLGPPLVLVGMLLLGLLAFLLFCISALWMSYAGGNARFSSEAVTVYSRRRGCIVRLKWAEIDCMRKRRDAPFNCWEIVPRVGEALSLPMVDEKALIAACKAAGVPIKRDGRSPTR